MERRSRYVCPVDGSVSADPCPTCGDDVIDLGEEPAAPCCASMAIERDDMHRKVATAGGAKPPDGSPSWVCLGCGERTTW